MIDISKDGTRFCHYPFIEMQLDRLGRELEGENWLEQLPVETFCERAAYYLGEWNMVHPFREGNGRVQRTLLSQLAAQAGYLLNWQTTTAKEMIHASRMSAHAGDNSLFASLVRREITTSTEQADP